MSSPAGVPGSNPWDDYADLYAEWIAQREASAVDSNPVVSLLLESLGELTGRRLLDAGCGEGFLARQLAQRGARVTGIDLSPRLIQIARTKQSGEDIDYRVADLAEPQADLVDAFDTVASHMVLNDVRRITDFAQTMHDVTQPGGRLAFALNNPYSHVVRGHLTDYFASGAEARYGGFWTMGVKAQYVHRTLEDHMAAFLRTGLQLVALRDVPSEGGLDWLLPKESRFPLFMVLVFEKPRR